MPIQSALTQKCTRCKVVKSLDQFRPRIKDSKNGRKGELGDKCGKCMDDDARFQSQKRKRATVEEVSDDEDVIEVPRPTVVSLHTFLQKVSAGADANRRNLDLSADVDCGTAVPKDCDAREKADKLATILGKATSWRWM